MVVCFTYNNQFHCQHSTQKNKAESISSVEAPNFIEFLKNKNRSQFFERVKWYTIICIPNHLIADKSRKKSQLP
ncbi:hypothetical protein ERO13_D12G268250v2 [Gossypium hirsutum]|uniref:Uncharacterized protein n=2 Tax=Gossypium TaxID=3633 RepID=A0A5J5P5A2_GOSBA|nr:hypothetical protein ES319_D12G296900v1 [Gossypium barbadense]KAG4118038.1 hypothetical protein ERO13_D12G268250v2 [Gossypium hirsutum]TYI53227.1 hypothetical protein E1A91_D12G304100v1 [Gossypium mustelinum]